MNFKQPKQNIFRSAYLIGIDKTITMKNLMRFALPLCIVFAVQACSLPRYDSGSISSGPNPSGVSTSSTDPANTRPTDGTTFTGGTPTGSNSGTSPFSAGMPSMGTANSTSSGISGEELASADAKRANVSFISQAAVSAMSATELSKLAMKNAQREEVKNLASALIKDHEKLSDDLKVLAAAQSVTWPKSSSPNLKKLTETSTGDFDQSYLRMLLQDNETTIALFQQASKSSDPSVKAYAVKYLPVLKTYTKQINSLSRQISREK